MRFVRVAASLWLAVAAYVLTDQVTGRTGLHAAYFPNQTQSGPPAITTIDPDISTATLDRGPARLWPSFSAEWTGFIAIERGGPYTFATTSDDGSQLEVAGVVIVENGGVHGPQRAVGQATLAAGVYPLRLRYTQAGGGVALQLEWALGDENLRPIPAGQLLPEPVSLARYRARRYLPWLAALVTIPIWLVLVPSVTGRFRRRLPEPEQRRAWARLARPSVAGPLVFLVAMAARVAVFRSSQAMLWPDSDVFYFTANGILEGRFLSHDPFRTLLYPYFLASILYWGHSPPFGQAIVAAQHLLGVTATLLFYDAGRRVFPPGVALIGALAFSLHPLMLFYETSIMSEALFVFVLSITVAFAVRSMAQVTPARAAVFGVLCATLTLVRPIGQWFVVAALVLWVIAAQTRRQRLLIAACMLGAYLGLILPWMAVNQRDYGFFGVSLGRGLGMFTRVFEVAQLPPTPTADPLVLRLTAAPVKSLANRTYLGLQQEYRYTPARADEEMYRMALDAVRAHPLAFAIDSLDQWASQLGGSLGGVRSCDDPTGPYLCSGRTTGYSLPPFPNSAKNHFFQLRALVVRYMSHGELPAWPVLALALLGLISMLAGPVNSRTATVLLGLTIVYFTAVPALTQWPQDRYRLPIDALLFLFAAQGLIALIRSALPRGGNAE